MKYYFLSGLPRAGNTIISCILNQNKDIGVSANSLVSSVLYNLEEMKKTDRAFNNFRDEKSYHSMMSSIIPSYYATWKCKYIIDRDTNNGSLKEKFEYLFHPQGQLVRALSSINNLKTVDPDKKIHILVDYNEFIDNPAEQLDRIYKFLDIPYYMHNLKHIDQFKSNGVRYDDNQLGKDMHKIRSDGISKRKYDVKVPQVLIDRCREFNIW